MQLKLLVKAIKFVLKKSIKLGGSSINDYALVSGKLGNYQNNVKVYTTDICVPISNLVEAIQFAETEIQNYDFYISVYRYISFVKGCCICKNYIT